MIGMLVRDQDGGERFRIAVGGFQAFEGLFAGQAGIDQQTGPLRRDQRGVAGARRRENRDFDDTVASAANYYYNVVAGGAAALKGTPGYSWPRMNADKRGLKINRPSAFISG